MISYFLELHFSDEGGNYRIVSSTKSYRPSEREQVVFSRPYIENEDIGEYFYPLDVRQKYEELTGKTEFTKTDRKPFNLVPVLADDNEVVYDCPCAWGQRVKGHAVYCQNEGWLYSPRKCQRGSWDESPPQETCPGFLKNENFKPVVGDG